MLSATVLLSALRVKIYGNGLRCVNIYGNDGVYMCCISLSIQLCKYILNLCDEIQYIK